MGAGRGRCDRKRGKVPDMPHFGLMDESRMSKEEAALMRARLHVRCGRRRLAEEKIAAGLAALYDGLVYGMRWRILTTALRKQLGPDEDKTLEMDGTLFSILRQAGVLDEDFDFAGFESLVAAALSGKVRGDQCRGVYENLSEILTRLGVMPFDEQALPPEDPATF